ncbi:MAG: beta-ketoacyl-ACP synthase II [Prolixibacteraceae bacterium]|nr:beta-ketoacyl-ACP synthase II [Prolixibacteraceae bacterium]
MELKRVVITGLGTINPLGNSIEEYWKGLKNGVSGASTITRMDISNHKTHFACQVKDFDATLYMNKKEARKCDLYSLYAIAAAQEAFNDSGINLETLNKERAGVIWGVGIGGGGTFFDEVRSFNPEHPKVNPFFIPKIIANMAGGLISIRFGLKGPSFTTVSACASSSHSMIQAYNLIRLGKSEVFITGGSESAVNNVGLSGFNSMRAISTRNDDPLTASRPFDKDRDGFVIGEGAGALVFEEYQHAIDRGAKIYAEVVGEGMSSDAYHMTAPDPEGRGAVQVMKEAINDAGLKPEDIGYINLHGTSTPLGDLSEAKAIGNTFGDYTSKLSISSTKSMTGHLLGAAGAIEAIASIMVLREGIIPPTINHFTDDPDIDSRLDLTFNKPKKREVEYALSNTFGFGGHNATLILKKY